tara:strand:+ start:2442 stop:3119 length:678 start_codon:yes stop_codon:yes gene_type:complete
MKVSVIMSCYNSQQTVGRAIESILNQTLENIELLICDDSSIDNTYEIITKYKDLDKRVKVYKNIKNLGLTKTLNFLIEKADGALIARQDDDDISLSERLKTQVNVLKEENLDFITTRAKVLGSKKLIPGISFNLPNSLVMNFKNPFIHGTLLIDKEVLSSVGNYDERFYYAQDYKLFSDLLSRGYKYATLKTPLYELNIKDNISSKFIKEQDYYARCVRNNKDPN